MRRAAAYHLNTTLPSVELARAVHADAVAHVRDWLRQKGARDGSWAFEQFYLPATNGDRAACHRESRDAEVGAYDLVTLDEPRPDGGELRTTHCVLRLGTKVELFAAYDLRERPPAPHAPGPEFRPECPDALRDVAAARPGWRLGNLAYDGLSRRFKGPGGGAEFAQLVTDPSRTAPVVVVSEDQRAQLHPGLDRRLADELAGLALVCVLDEEASWELTRRVTDVWSCYQAAVRLYWPQAIGEGADPYAHPLWTAAKLLGWSDSTEHAAARVTEQLRARVCEWSAANAREPAAVALLRRLPPPAATERVGRAETDDDLRKLADELAAENERLRRRLDRVVTERDRARAELAHRPAAKELAPAPPAADGPATVAEAFESARETLADALVFGDDCPEGVAGLHPEAGPPGKILDWLQRLAECSRQKRAGALGKTVSQWLWDHGVQMSDESETDATNARAQVKRTWHDGFGPRTFEAHLKPTNRTTPDRCVRIYFDWVEDAGKFAVGWLGRHP